MIIMATENGMKTLEIRMEKINSNAMEIATELQKNPEIQDWLRFQ